tara:strand:+ start:2084 stop:2272 length:189 start_codon:yes stop_codon:yes gene_type:complete
MTNENKLNTELTEAKEMTRYYQQRMYNTGLKDMFDYYQAKFMEAITYERGLKKAIEIINAKN